MKRKSIVLLGIISVLTAFTACGERFGESQSSSQSPHTHEYSQGETVSPTDTEEGYTWYECSCGNKYRGDIVIPNGALEYVVNEDGTTCTVTGVGKYYPSHLTIDKVEGYTVTAIADRAFYACNTLSKVVLADSIQEVGEYAFYGCLSLFSATLPASLKEIKPFTFANSSIEEVQLSSTLTKIGEKAFYNCAGIRSLEFPSGLLEIGSGAFFGCANLTNASLPKNLQSIGNLAFMGSNLKEVIIPKQVSYIGEGAFAQCAMTPITVYCEAEAKPDSWHENWDAHKPNRENGELPDDRKLQVVWKYIAE
jgi:hypothetical protein